MSLINAKCSICFTEDENIGSVRLAITPKSTVKGPREVVRLGQIRITVWI
jgi:hypothetical protein